MIEYKNLPSYKLQHIKFATQFNTWLIHVYTDQVTLRLLRLRHLKKPYNTEEIHCYTQVELLQKLILPL